MALFGKNRANAGGLGRDVTDVPAGASDTDARSAVIDGSSSSAEENIPTPREIEADSIVRDMGAPKQTRAERRAAAKIAKDAGADDAPAGPKKSRKAQKLEKAALQAADDDKRPSNMVMIDFYPGMAKEDAIETARHWAMTHMNLPSLCFYYVMKMRDGFAIEVQEGVGKAYLPSVMQLAQANPGRLIIVPMIRRKMTVFYSQRLGEFEAQILPELQEPPSMPENPPLQASRGPAMTPIMKQYREWMVSGIVAAGIGGFALLSSLTFYAFDPKAKVPPEWRTTDVALLPVMQWNRLQADATDSYVTRLEFADGQWRVVRQAVGASVDVATPDATASAGGIVGGAVPDAAPLAPGAIPPAGPVPGASPSQPQAGATAPSQRAPGGSTPNTIPPPSQS